MLWVLYLRHHLNQAKDQLLYNRTITDIDRARMFAEIDAYEDLLNLPETLNLCKEADFNKPAGFINEEKVSKSQSEVMGQIHGV
jgi:hypothetical protein